MPLLHASNLCAHLQNVARVGRPLTSIPHNKLNLQIALGLYREGFLCGVQRGDIYGPDAVYTETTPENVASRRLWLELKYRQNQPVLSNMKMVSKPSRRMILSTEDLRQLQLGRKVKFVTPPKIGEVILIKTAGNNSEIIELNEACRRFLGGEVILRAS
ncbi:37S ribosomal protein S8 [Yarrowia sp. B02]|nr:37S ribosomal protein S8 [Yarrowia sp. B02]